MTIQSGSLQRMQQARTMSKEQDLRSEIDGIFARFGFNYPRCGISIGKGWVPIFEEFLQEIILSGYEVKFEQVKQKFGDLRIYFQSPNQKEVQELLNKAEKRCSETCELCGNPAKNGNHDGWLAVLCKACSKARDDERASNKRDEKTSRKNA